jgi:hypothetical protein
LHGRSEVNTKIDDRDRSADKLFCLKHSDPRNGKSDWYQGNLGDVLKTLTWGIFRDGDGYNQDTKTKLDQGIALNRDYNGASWNGASIVYGNYRADFPEKLKGKLRFRELVLGICQALGNNDLMQSQWSRLEHVREHVVLLERKRQAVAPLMRSISESQ